MELPARSAPLGLIAACSTAFVGVLLAIGGVGLAVAVLSTAQPRLQTMTGSVLLLVGGIDLVASLGIRRRRAGAMYLCGAATLGLLGYLAVALHDFGEIFWLNVALLLLLAALRDHILVRPGLT